MTWPCAGRYPTYEVYAAVQARATWSEEGSGIMDRHIDLRRIGNDSYNLDGVKAITCDVGPCGKRAWIWYQEGPPIEVLGEQAVALAAFNAKLPPADPDNAR